MDFPADIILRKTRMKFELTFKVVLLFSYQGFKLSFQISYIFFSKMCFSCATDIILSQASHYVKHFLIIISAGKGDAPKVGRYLIFMTLSLRVGCERFKRTFYLQQLKSQIGLLYLSEGVCLACSKLLFLLRNLDFQTEFF